MNSVLKTAQQRKIVIVPVKSTKNRSLSPSSNMLKDPRILPPSMGLSSEGLKTLSEEPKLRAPSPTMSMPLNKPVKSSLRLSPTMKPLGDPIITVSTEKKKSKKDKGDAEAKDKGEKTKEKEEEKDVKVKEEEEKKEGGEEGEVALNVDAGEGEKKKKKKKKKHHHHHDESVEDQETETPVKE